MKIIINDVECVVDGNTIKNLLSRFIGDGLIKSYEEYVDKKIRIGLKAIVRQVLYETEKKMREAEHPFTENIRPPRGVDPVIHMFGLLETGLIQVLDHATLSLEIVDTTTEGTPVIGNFTLELNQSSSGGQVAGSRDDREREDNVLPPTSGESTKALSQGTSLRAG